MLNLQRSLGLAGLAFASSLCLATSCGSDTPSSNPPAATGGTPNSGSGGSATPTGGTKSSTGGVSGGTPSISGGTPGVSTGGSVTSGGTPGNGGSVTSGGTPGSGGSAGAPTGGSVASGGTSAGAAGSGGASGGSAGSSGGSGGSSTGKGFVREDFEGQTTGKQPTGWDNFVAWNKNGMNPASDASALVNETRAHSGTKSMLFKGGGNPAMITRPLETGTKKLYVRAWFYMTRQLGQVPDANHETLIGIRGKTGEASDEIRFGEIKGAIGTNEVPSDNISPKMDMWGKGPVIPANAWNCIEVAFLADQANHELHAWHNGTEVHSVTAGDQWQNGTMPATWMNGKFLEVIVGWHSFSSDANEVWIGRRSPERFTHQLRVGRRRGTPQGSDNYLGVAHQRHLTSRVSRGALGPGCRPCAGFRQRSDASRSPFLWRHLVVRSSSPSLSDLQPR